MRYIDIIIKMKTEEDIDKLVEDDVQLNYWLGSTLKGAIIHKMKYKYCNQKDFNCSNCNLGLLCPIQALFNEKNIQTKGNASNPIILNTFLDENTCTNEFYINVKLFAHGLMYKDLIESILIKGIKIKSKSKYINFKASNIGYRDMNGNICFEPILLDSGQANSKYNGKSDTLLVNIESPLRIQKSASDFDFSQLLRIMMTRVDSVGILDGATKVYDTNLLEKAKSEIRLIENNTNKVNLIRNSTHHNKKFNEQCYIGSLIYQGDLSPYMDIIKTSEIFNIGKWTTMGLGRIRVELI